MLASALPKALRALRNYPVCSTDVYVRPRVCLRARLFVDDVVNYILLTSWNDLKKSIKTANLIFSPCPFGGIELRAPKGAEVSDGRT